MYNDLSFSSNHLIGIIYGTLSGLFYGLSIPIQKKISHYVNPMFIILYQLVVITVITLPFMFFIKFSWSLNSILLSIIYALFFVIGGTYFYFKGIKDVEAQHVGIIAYVEPIAVLLFGIMFFNEVPGINTLIGGVLVLFSGYLVIMDEVRRK